MGLPVSLQPPGQPQPAVHAADPAASWLRRFHPNIIRRASTQLVVPVQPGRFMPLLQQAAMPGAVTLPTCRYRATPALVPAQVQALVQAVAQVAHNSPSTASDDTQEAAFRL